MFIKPILFALSFALALPGWAKHPSKLKNQNKYKRVRQARARKGEAIEALFKKAEISYPPAALFLRVFKQEDQLELWARKRDRSYQLIKSYAVCMKSGSPGPKRRSGDYQVPEGVYRINRFNPHSSFLLSLGLDYPNKSDRIRGRRSSLGGDIFIHGSCVTIGCLPLTDAEIEELYVIAIDTKNRRIPIHIFPARMEPKQMEALYKEHPKHKAFWAELLPIYQAFEQEHRLPKLRIDKRGVYQLR